MYAGRRLSLAFVSVSTVSWVLAFHRSPRRKTNYEFTAAAAAAAAAAGENNKIVGGVICARAAAAR